ncbi:MAG TPA: ESX secretion-associated protein EspG [Pseudonocardiaceae bacterium]|nr:ESX secretion-associated protein EspG [Pseudonocardiaceae bacterium]
MTAVQGADPATEPIAISAVEFDVLWEHLRLTEMPLVLRVPSPGRTHAERRELIASAWQSLSRRGLCHRLSVDDRLANLLRLLESPDQEIDGRFGATKGVRLLVAAAADEAVFALLTKHGLTLSEIPVTGLAREALAALPHVPAGPGESITVRAADLDAAATRAPDADAFEVALHQRGLSPRDATTLRRMLGNVRRQGQFGASARTRNGHRRRAPHVIGFFDTEAGRYLQLRQTTADGVEWSTISPADTRLLTTQLADLLANITASATEERFG